MTAKEFDLSFDSFLLHEPSDKRVANPKKIGIFSFFSGAGFLDLGFEVEKQFQIQFVNELHLPFLQTYRYSRHNLKLPEPLYGYCADDITHLLKGELYTKLEKLVKASKRSGKPVGWCGGPPCPDFSVGGKNRGRHGDNGKLSGTYIKLICKLKPDFFLFENVKGLYRTAKHRKFFEHMKKQLTKSGYVLTERLVNALSYGAPQDRDRILLIGFLKDSKRLGFDPEPVIARFPWTYQEGRPVDELKEYPWPTRTAFQVNKEMAAPTDIPLELTVQHWFDKNRVTTHPNANHYFQPRAGLKKFLVIDEGDDKKKSYKRLHRWRYSPTAAYGNNEVHLHPYLARRISVSEALAIQSLPANFLVPPSIALSDMFKTVGNGVPFLLANGIAKTIGHFIDTKGQC